MAGILCSDYSAGELVWLWKSTDSSYTRDSYLMVEMTLLYIHTPEYCGAVNGRISKP